MSGAWSRASSAMRRPDFRSDDSNSEPGTGRDTLWLTIAERGVLGCVRSGRFKDRLSFALGALRLVGDRVDETGVVGGGGVPADQGRQESPDPKFHRVHAKQQGEPARPARSG